LNYWQNASKIERSKTSTKNPSRLLIFEFVQESGLMAIMS
jgi:hypothetical protein